MPAFGALLQAGATDGEFTNGVGIPTYGVEPVFLGPDVGHVHGLNEYVGVNSLLEGREFLYGGFAGYAASSTALASSRSISMRSTRLPPTLMR
jgi:hypothetical protein